MPPLYIGTECPRTPETLKKIGFNGSEHIVGMDFPANSLHSFYRPKEIFHTIVYQQAIFLCRMGFKTVIIVNGHGADNQIAILNDIANTLSYETGAQVISQFILFDECDVGVGHAGLLETSVMQALIPQSVDLSALPPKPLKLKNTDYAIVDIESFETGGNKDFTVRHDPRDANANIGRKVIEYEINQCIKILKDII